MIIKGNKLILLIMFEAVLSYALYEAPLDIAIYYSFGAMLSVSIALIAVMFISTNSARVYSVIILGQAILCLFLVPDWSYSINELLQYKLTAYNATLVKISIVLGAISSDRITNYFMLAIRVPGNNRNRDV